MRALGLFCAVWLSAASSAATAQEVPRQVPSGEAEAAVPAERPPAPQGGVELDEATRAALTRLAEDLAAKEREREDARPSADTESIARLDAEIDQLHRQFTSLAAHVDLQALAAQQGRGFDLEAEVLELVRPLVAMLKELTAEPRQLDDLDERLRQIEQQLRVARAAAARLSATRDALPVEGPARERAQRELDGFWRPHIGDLEREQLVLSASRQRLLGAQKSFWARMTELLQGFLQQSGLNLLLCGAVFAGVFFGMRFLTDLLLRRYRGPGFSVRLFDVLLRTLAVLLAIAATLVVPYARNDWFLLAIGIVFLLGAGWVVVKAAPQFFEQFRLLLNVGAVREGERILVEGLPYRVESLRFYSRLRNPELAGGMLRVPIKQLVGSRSRPLGPGEPWFPCRQGDVVALADGTVGRVELQTPETVVVVERNDAPRSYPTGAFLLQHPRTLSRGFEIVATCRLDYRHQPDATDRVPALLREALQRGLAEAGDAVRDVHVELENAGDSGLEFAVIVEFDGEAAHRYHALRRRVQVVLVAACTEHGLAIPYPQVTVHHAGSAGRPSGAPTAH